MVHVHRQYLEPSERRGSHEVTMRSIATYRERAAELLIPALLVDWSKPIVSGQIGPVIGYRGC